MTARDYEGTELDLFADARNWKAYWSKRIAPYVRGRVLDVGAGIGATIDVLSQHVKAEWTALEPDAALAQRIARDVEQERLPRSTRVLNGRIQDLPVDAQFDTILYIDVLEHIEDDAAELEGAARHLAPMGHLVVLAPAHNGLYSPFDRAIGHFRRYDSRALRAICPPHLRPISSVYLDSAGLIASLANRLLLKQASPTAAQIAVWDRLLVPASLVTDRLFFGKVGKSILLVCQRDY